MGVVRQAVNRSAGSSGFMGSSSLVLQAASWMQFLTGEGTGDGWEAPDGKRAPPLLAVCAAHNRVRGTGLVGDLGSEDGKRVA